MRFADYEGFDFGFVFRDDEADKSNYLRAEDGYPQIIRSDLGEVFVKVLFRMFSANSWVLIDLAVPLG